MSLTWLITGASSGLGASLALAALKAGHKVIGTARNIPKAQQNYPDVERLGGSWLELDVTDPNTEAIVSKAVAEHGVTIVVNNAGYGLRGVLESITDAQMQHQMDANFFGALRVTKGALPHLRARRAGCIVNISSTSGISASPGYALYAASKFALEGASEALAAEVAPFGVRVLVVEPGAFRTNFQAVVVEGEAGAIPEAYRGTPADDVRARIAGSHGKQPGDPDRAASAIFEVVTGTGRGEGQQEFLRLPLGKDAVVRANAKIEAFKKNVVAMEPISVSAVYADGE